MKFRKFIMCSSVLITFPATLSVLLSCSAANEVETSGFLNSYKEIKKYQDENKKMFEAKEIDNNNLLGTKEIENNGNLDDFESNINQYLSFNEEFKNLLTKDNNKIFKEIKQINLHPIVNTKNVKVIIFLGSNKNDKNVVFETIENVLKNDFSYKKEFLIVKKDNPEINNLILKNEFDEQFKKLVDEKNLNLLDKGFNIDESVKQEILANFDKFIFKIESSYFLSISLTEQALNDGFIIKISKTDELKNQYWPTIISNQIAKEK